MVGDISKGRLMAKADLMVYLLFTETNKQTNERKKKKSLPLFHSRLKNIIFFFFSPLVFVVFQA